MSWPLVWRRNRDADVAAANAETVRQRKRAEKAEEVARVEVEARRSITGRYCELSDEHDQTVRRNQSLCAQLAELEDAAGIEAKARRQADRIAYLQNEVSRARKELAEERDKSSSLGRQVKALQKQVDEALGLDATTIRSSAPWQPGYKPQPDKKVTTP